MTREEVEKKFAEWARANGAAIDHQMSDVPYTNAIFKTTDGKTIVASIMEDVEGYY